MNPPGAAQPGIRLLGPGDYRSMPWRNGRGTTLELAREDDAAGALLWRVSTAEVVEAGDFSQLPGLDRILMLVEGPGFDLHFAEAPEPVTVAPLVPVCFSGDWATRAENVSGVSRDLNVMAARDRVRASVVLHRDRPFRGKLASRSLFLVLQGRWSLRIGGEIRSLDATEMLVVAMAEGLVQGEGAGLLVQIDCSFL